jgi:hypothetical protein
VGVPEAGLLGFGLGWLTAHMINLMVAAFERGLERRLATMTTLEGMTGGLHGQE